jgi:hypothetical protein
MDYLLLRIVYPAEQITVNSGIPVLGDNKFTGVAVISTLIAAVPLGFIVANVVVWLIPSWGVIDNKASKGVPLASFREGNRGLFLVAIIPVTLSIVFSILSVLYR